MAISVKQLITDGFDGLLPADYIAHIGELNQQLAASQAEIERLRAIVDRLPKCDICGKPATCIGNYDGSSGFACDDCCGHGNEDGYCKPITGAAITWLEDCMRLQQQDDAEAARAAGGGE